MSEAQTQTLRAEKLPEQPTHRRVALGRGIGSLLLRQRLGTAARQMPGLAVPAWAAEFDPPQKVWLKKVLRKAHG